MSCHVLNNHPVEDNWTFVHKESNGPRRSVLYLSRGYWNLILIDSDLDEFEPVFDCSYTILADALRDLEHYTREWETYFDEANYE